MGSAIMILTGGPFDPHQICTIVAITMAKPSHRNYLSYVSFYACYFCRIHRGTWCSRKGPSKRTIQEPRVIYAHQIALNEWRNDQRRFHSNERWLAGV